MTLAATARPDARSRIEARLRLLEIEAQLQRTALAASLSQLERHQPLAWLGASASIAAGLAGKALAAPNVRWLLLGLAMRLIKNWRHGRKASKAGG